ncbi:inositol 1,4,5-triphosphate receptor associated 2 isoform X2 [Narcine bancroftii]|uniref:inositol 1,4,5-triphosphate receptor associated 2 isoform X2 n=1 Tax=Narcine bancroftii TaxID=1343680 RepID=UPI0038313008
MSCKRHHPVESLSRKLQTIRMRDQVSNPMLKIPKFCSRNLDGPQVNLKRDMEVILKNRTGKNQGLQQEVNITVANAPSSPEITLVASGQASGGAKSPSITSAYTIVSAAGEMAAKPLHCCGAQTCSTPVAESDRNNATLSCPPSSIIEHRFLTSGDCLVACSPVNSTNFSFCAHLHRPRSRVAKKLSLAETGVSKPSASNSVENTADESVICEEDLLDTIFYACDTRHRGKVCVSKIVDYLRRTTSRMSDDSGLEDLFNMLDPDSRDISIDLVTYRAVMKEWIEDCRRNSTPEEIETVSVTEEEPLSDGLGSGTKFSDGINGTVGSLEALGGEISRGDLEMSDLISCIADLQYNYQKLQERNLKLRLTIDATEESNNRLIEKNEELLSQVRSAQQSVLMEKSLKEDLEELKSQIAHLEESKGRLDLQNNQAAKDNQSLIQKITSLQEENLRCALDIEALQEKVVILTEEKAELQMQLTDLESLARNKDTVLLERENYVKELKHSLEEYSMIVEGLRNEKAKLKSQLLFQQELVAECINASAIPQDGLEIFRAQSSLQLELLNAQNASEENFAEWQMVSHSTLATFEKMLDKEVLNLLQGSEGKQTALQFKVISTQMHLANSLQERRRQWLQNISTLEEQKAASDCECVQLANSFCRNKTQLLHFKQKELARRHQLEAQKEVSERAAAEAALQLQQVRRQLASLRQELCEEEEVALASVRPKAQELPDDLEAARWETPQGSTPTRSGTRAPPASEPQIVHSPREKLFQQEFCELNWQTESCCKQPVFNVARPEGLSGTPQYTLPYIPQGRSQKSVTTLACTPLLDALMLEHPYPLSFFPGCAATTLRVCTVSSTPGHQSPMTSATDELFGGRLSNRCTLNPDGVQTSEGLSVSSLNGELLIKAPAEEALNHNELLETGGNPEVRQRGENRVVASNGSAMSGSAPLDTSTKQTDDSSQDVKRTHREDSESSAIVDGESEDGPRPTTGSQLIAESCASHKKQPESRSRLKVSLEDTRGSVALDEPSPCEGKPNSTTPTCKAEAEVQSAQCQDRPKKTTLQRATTSEQEVEAEFLRFSLAFKCDMFTLDKRLRLEERSRDLAEINLQKEIEKCQQTLQTVRPLCEQEQSLEIFEKLEKSLRVLTQTITRVVSRAEMLGAIHQETRVSKAVEVMIQYVENLKRMYAKEHSELEEMRQLLLQNGGPVNPLRELQDDHRNKRFLSSHTYGKGSMRRVSIATLPRNSAGIQQTMSRLREIEEGRRKSEGDQEKLCNKFTRKMSSWTFLGQKSNDASKSQPSLHQFISTCTWGDEGSQQLNKDTTTPELEVQRTKIRQSEPILSEQGNNDQISSQSTVNKRLLPNLAELWDSLTKSNRGPWLPVLLLFTLSVLGSFLIGLSLHTSVDAAAVSTGDSWKAIQQFLSPYAGLQHNGQPPV